VVFRAQEHVWWPQNVVLPRWGANTGPTNPLAAFEGPFRGGRKDEKGKKRREREKEEGDGREGRNPNKFVVAAMMSKLPVCQVRPRYDL